MFKKLFLSLILITALLISPVIAVDVDNEKTCTLLKDSIAIQVLSDKSIIVVAVPEDISITMGRKLIPEEAKTMTSETGMDWTEGIMGSITVDFAGGYVYDLLVIVLPSYLKDCN